MAGGGGGGGGGGALSFAHRILLLILNIQDGEILEYDIV